MGMGSGFGKAILFNEHFVVYGIPGIASAIDLKTIATVEPHEGPGIYINDRRVGTKGYSTSKLEHQREAINRMLAAMGLAPEEHSLAITLNGDLPTFSGIGASAANCVAIARALSEEYGLELADDSINEIAYEGERAYAGTPSGIDNTAATYGGLIWFKRSRSVAQGASRSANVIERLRLKEPIEIVMGNTGVVANTKAAVAGVRERREKAPEKYDGIFKEAERLVHEARRALEAYDLRAVGRYMDANQALLREIEVSSDELELLVELARTQGALGAKLTGGGLGGCMVALTPGKALQAKVAEAMEQAGFQALRTTIG